MNPTDSPLRRLRAPALAVLVGLLVQLLPAGIASARTPASDYALNFDGTDDYVSMGPAPAIGALSFTLEAWIKRTGNGGSTSTGNLGFDGTNNPLAIPIVSKGRADADGSNLDMNFFLGLDATNGRLAADFEDKNSTAGASGDGSGLNHPFIGNTTVSQNVWHHVAATYDATTGLWKLYLDGSLDGTSPVQVANASGSPVALPQDNSIEHMAIGAALTSVGARGGAFQGQIDETRVWNYARAQSQIQSGMNNEIDAASGLLGRWGLNEGTGTTTADSAGSGVTGVLGGDQNLVSIAASRPLWTDGTYSPVPGAGSSNVGNAALSLNGTSQYVYLGANNANLGSGTADNASSFTLEIWFKQTGDGTTGQTGAGGLADVVPLLTKGRNENDGSNVDMNYYLGIQGGTGPNVGKLVVDFEDKNSTSNPANTGNPNSSGVNHPFTGNTVVTRNAWHHAAVTYNVSNGIYNVYLDGSLDATSTAQTANAAGNPIAIPRWDSIQTAAIGSALTSAAVPGSLAPGGFFQGQVDEARIWRNVVRDQNAIRANAGVELNASGNAGLHVWHLNETTNATNSALDSGVATLVPGTPIGSPAHPAGTSGGVAFGGSALSLDGFNDHVVMTASGVINSPLNSSLYTAELWFNWNGGGVTAFTGTGGLNAFPLITKGRAEGETAAADVDYFLGISTDTGHYGVLAADYEEAQGQASPSLNHPVYGGTPISLNTWHHAAVTFDGSNLTVYLDGVADGTLTGLAGRNPNNVNTSPVAVGSSYLSGGTPGTSNGPGAFGGLVEEVQIWKTALSGSFIQSHMASPVASDPNLVGRWATNEGAGTTAVDSAGSNNGTLVNGPAWVLGVPALASPNHAPAVSPVINGASPNTNDVLSVTPNGVDADGDSLSYTYQWIKNGSDIAGATNTSLNLANPGNGDKGDQISVRVRAHDGFTYSTPVTPSVVTVLNTAPVVDSVTIDQPSPTPTTTLSATIASHDDDNDAVTYAYQWRKNGSNLGGQTAATLDLGAVGAINGDQFALRVTGNDGSVNSAPITSSAVTVSGGNTAPVVDSAVIDQTSPHTNDTLSVTVTAHDAESNPLTYAYQWSKNNVDIGGATSSTLNLATAGNGDRGDVIRVRVTANDGSLDSTPVTSSPVTILDTAPTATVSLNNHTPTTNATITATATKADIDSSDSVSLTYVWTVAGITRQTTSTSALTDTFDLSLANHGSKGDAIVVTVTPTDGTLSGSPVSDSATVANSAPTLSSAVISSATPHTNDVLSVVVTSADADNDTVTYTYQWLKNASPLAGQTASTLNLATAGNGNKGDQISVQVTGHDGTADSSPLTSSSVTIQNSAPAISTVSINQASPHTNDTLSVSISASDLDNDTLSFSYQWIKNGSAISGATLPTLELALSGNGDRNDQISVQVTAYDGTTSSNSPTSSAVTILNTAPTATVSLNNHSPSTTATITATATKSDVDPGDTVTLTYVWKVNGSTVKTTSNTSSLTDSLDLSLPGNGDNGQTVSVEVTPSDGSLAGSPVSDSALVGNSAPVVDSVAINETTPHTTDLLHVTVTAHDPDGPAPTLSYQWTKNGVDISGQTGATLNLATVGNGDHGDLIRVRVTANDGAVNSTPVTSSSVTVLNTAPTVTAATIPQTSPHTADVLTVQVTSGDIDDDAVSFGYQWTKNGVDLGGQTGATLNLATAGNGDKGDLIRVRVTANDGSANSSPVTSSPVTILNTAPTATVSLDNHTPGTAATLTASATRNDIDPGETVTLTYEWKVNGVTKRTQVTTLLSDQFDLSVAGNGDAGDAVTVTVTPFDGTVNGTPQTDSATVAGGGGGGHAPVAQDANYGVGKAEPRSITLPATDADSDPLTFAIVTPPSSGTLSGGTGATRTYTPVNSFVGVVTFTFRANDGSANSNLGTVTITIAPKKKITISDASFNPLNTAPAICGAVRFVNKGTSAHSAADTSGLNLFSSGAINPNAEFDYRYTAAGNYDFLIGSTTGRAKVPVKTSATAGGISTVFDIQWACQDPLAGYVFDVQIKRAGSTKFVDWQNGVTTMHASFVADAGTGTYKFRARMRNTAGGASSDWSAAKKITVS